MIQIKKGIFFYKLVTTKTDKYKSDLLHFLFKQKLSNQNLEIVDKHDFNTDTNIIVKHIKFTLNIKSNLETNEVILLFQTDLDTNGFNDLIEGFFE